MAHLQPQGINLVKKKKKSNGEFAIEKLKIL